MADTSVYDEFVTASSPRLLRTAYLLTRDWAAAEDLLQTALMKAWFAWRRLDGEPEAYVRRIIATTYVSWRRRRWSSEISHGELPESPSADATAAVDERSRLWSALGRLPARQRAVLVLRFYEDLTEQQVAATLGVAVGTVKSQTAKALTKLRADTSMSETAPVLVAKPRSSMSPGTTERT